MASASLRKFIPLSLRRTYWDVLARRKRPRKGVFDRVSVAARYLSGSGIEIGALHNPVQVPASVTVKYVDRMSVQDLRHHYPELRSLPLVDVDILDDGEFLSTIEESSQDFVIANHFLEHCQNPLLTMRNMLRTLKGGGVLFMALPDKRFTFDVDRPTTTLEHVVNDFESGPLGSRRQHYLEWAELVYKKPPTEIESCADQLMETDYSIHFHVWTQFEIMELIIASRRKLGLAFDVEVFLKLGDEVLFILRKSGSDLSHRDG